MPGAPSGRSSTGSMRRDDNRAPDLALWVMVGVAAWLLLGTLAYAGWLLAQWL